MMWLFKYYDVPQETNYIRDYTLTFFDNKMMPYVITRKNNILIENNLLKIMPNEKNDSDTDDSIDRQEHTDEPEVNNWYNYFY